MDFQLLISSKSNVTAQTVNQTLLKNSGTNNQGFIFGNILVQGKFILVMPGAPGSLKDIAGRISNTNSNCEF